MAPREKASGHEHGMWCSKQGRQVKPPCKPRVAAINDDQETWRGKPDASRVALQEVGRTLTWEEPELTCCSQNTIQSQAD